MLSKDYIFKRGSISTPIIPHDCFTTVTVELINNYGLLIYAETCCFYHWIGKPAESDSGGFGIYIMCLLSILRSILRHNAVRFVPRYCRRLSL